MATLTTVLHYRADCDDCAGVYPIETGHLVSMSPWTGVHPVDGTHTITGAHPNDSVRPFDSDSGAHPVDSDPGHAVSVSRLSADAPVFDYISGGQSVVAESEGRL